MKIDNLMIVGATHGNEPVGSHIVNRWKKKPEQIQRNSFNTHLLIANEDAAKRQQRYIDKDLNRCFHPTDLVNLGLSALEDNRAREINALIGPEGSSPQDMIVDLHTTTANMGTTIICEATPGNLMIAGSVKRRHPYVRIYCFPSSDRIQACLRSITPYGIGIEIGPISQNVVRHDIILAIEKVTQAILDVVDDFNIGVLNGTDLQVNAYEHVGDRAYPRCSTNDKAVIHRDIQDRDYCVLKQGTQLFINNDTEGTIYEGTSQLYPVFINEAAYYEKNIAFSLARKKKFLVKITGQDAIFSMP